MTHQDGNQSAAAAAEQEQDPALKAATDQALSKRRDGGSRTASVDILTAAGMAHEEADKTIDSFDELLGILHKVRPHDVSEAVGARLDELDIQPGSGILKKSPQELMNQATRKASQGASKGQLVTYLTSNGVPKDEAAKVASKVSLEMSAARAKFDESKKSASNRAWFSIAGGILLLIVGLAMMGSGAESSGRRSPLGAVIGGIAMIGFGIKDLAAADGQSFEGRAREVLR